MKVKRSGLELPLVFLLGYFNSVQYLSIVPLKLAWILECQLFDGVSGLLL